MRIYLSGNMTPCPGHYKKWTAELALDLAHAGIDVSVSGEFLSGKPVVHHDLARLRRCDLLVVNLSLTDPGHHLTGSVVEVFEAWRLGIPVYAFSDPGMPRSEQADSPFLGEFISHEFQDMEELTTHLRFDENLPTM